MKRKGLLGREESFRRLAETVGLLANKMDDLERRMDAVERVNDQTRRLLPELESDLRDQIKQILRALEYR